MGVQVFVTVGTSALEKFRNRSISGSRYEDNEVLIRELESSGYNSDLYNRQKEYITQQISNRIANYCTIDPPNWWAYTAEVGSLLAMKRGGLLSTDLSENQLFLFHSQTVGGKLCAEVVADSIITATGECQMVANADQVSVMQVDGLRVDQPDTFRQSLVNLDNLLTRAMQPNHKWFFNITGGFKALIPYATVLAWNNGMTICYLFDKAERLIRINRPHLYGNIPMNEVLNGTTGA